METLTVCIPCRGGGLSFYRHPLVDLLPDIALKIRVTHDSRFPGLIKEGIYVGNTIEAEPDTVRTYGVPGAIFTGEDTGRPVFIPQDQYEVI